MKENIEQMRKRHEKEIADLQSICPHEHQQVHVYVYGYLMHGGNWEDYCEDCGKVLAYYKTPYKTTGKGNSYKVEPDGAEERVESDKLEEWHKVHGYLWN